MEPKKKQEIRIGVLGGGSWATAIVKLLCNNCEKVNWWMRNDESIRHIQQTGHNPNYIQSIQFDTSQLNISSDFQEVVDISDYLIIAIPSAFLHETLSSVQPSGLEKKVLFSAIKGVINEFDSIPAHYFHKQLGVPRENIGLICGPCHAEEVAMEKLSYLTIGCHDIQKAYTIGEMLSCRYIRTCTTEDVFGAELAAVLKNVYAVASGICHGLGYGDNFQAVLISVAIREMERFLDSAHEVHRDVKSSAYLGDLLVTAYSPYSRNRTFGTMVGKGYSVKWATIEMNMVAEGYYATKGIFEINRTFNVDMPIAEAVYRILYDKISPMVEMRILSEKLS
ncbi:MAG: NAD(P)H-dependent glycerol-3-phosphate dehydrogenase [Crocinitomicaceae bacterium]|nr:NAD(P)H-dependent glycerol-3-phosphate dehydrogenase [Crocinitomicaceae bacterium]